MLPRTIEWDDERNVIKMVDQTLLPARLEVLECGDVDSLIKAIKEMKIRGAPALGVAGAFGVALATFNANSFEDVEEAARKLSTARPTAVNLSYGVSRAMQRVRAAKSLEEARRAALEEAKKMAEEDVATNRKIGEYGANLLEDDDNVLTICNAGKLACVDYGTALGVVRAAVEKGKRIRVFACETRPLNQGSRLTAFELLEDGIPVTLITDSMSGFVMQRRLVSKVIVGADRVVSDGFFNKIGTYSLAVLAKHHNIPFYVAAPLSSFDLEKRSGEVEIEIRSADELKFFCGVQIAPLDVDVYNPAFDFTPHELVTAFITEKGIFTPEELLELKRR
ncbi:MAG TPA: S-methyl-5-thioribose-1-phosphate isomerase [Methanomicrobia archaeon]|nr:5-methylthioribose/5-deoxyribulose 1-phosphate isomerase [Candidatus Alkanophaga volatiphilum]HDO64275.1 S-methyl-5-thioribose-1-phosphate isomerase [Methanomicrobia archaeon]HEX59868.1 S-methyl-5-thioribose-1-phosphate isomerase [Methanomicrobia archaeon]